MLTSLQEKLDTLEEKAACLRSEWDEDCKAVGVEKAVEDIRSVLPTLTDQTVSYETAAKLEGQTVGTIRNRVSRGELTNVGTQGIGRIPIEELHVGRLLQLLICGSMENAESSKTECGRDSV